jgi:hypothetical protein
MTPLRTLRLTDALKFQLVTVERIRQTVPTEEQGYLPLEIELCALATMVIRQVKAQEQERRDQRAARLAKLPTKAKAVPVVVDVRLTPKRKQTA